MDPDNIKCCISASCTSSSGTVGQCLDNSVLPCSGGAFQAGLCPGPDNVQCCLPTAQAPPPAPSPTPQPQPPAPSCASFMVVPDDIIPFFDDIIFPVRLPRTFPGSRVALQRPAVFAPLLWGPSRMVLARFHVAFLVPARGGLRIRLGNAHRRISA